ncbi:CYTH-like domain-containing protein [Gautieria morchelliformis]|nr:CYTH-like domain-containing protein [Gautieria morchelliformis]
MGPTVGELMSEQHINHEDDEEDEEEDEDDFVTHPRRVSSPDELEEASSKRRRYSPSVPDGYTRASPPAAAPTSTSLLHSQPYTPRPPGPSHTQASILRSPPSLKPALEHSILNVEPVDEFIREIADFVHRLIANRTEHIEIEAKVGILRDESGQRLRLPVGVETILTPDSPVFKFESNMSLIQHRHYNTMLNNLISEPSPADGPRTPLKHNHTRLVDSFYPPPKGLRERLRVTVDEKTGKVVQCIRKVRLGDLNIYSPKRNADWRISVNLELPAQQPMGTPLSTRRKDRMTYTHQYCNIDLTQVQQSATHKQPATLLHELEIELNATAMPIVLHSATRRHSTDANIPQEQRDEFDDIIRIFVNNARILVRNASNAWE